MSIAQATIELAKTVQHAITIPPVRRIYLPQTNVSEEFRDEFGLIFLQDGTAAPFYTSLPGTLDALQTKFGDGNTVKYNTLDLIGRFTDESLANKSIALGAFNAMSQHVMKRTGLLPQSVAHIPKNIGSGKPQKGEQIGMVGYFCPLIDKLLAQGVRVLVIEQLPERVEPRDGLSLSENVADLAQCRIVLCTAASLINDSIDEILSHCSTAQNFSIIGPSGSGLPDVLFEKGIDSVGGVYFPDAQRLSDKLDQQDAWGDAGEKYQLTLDSYPGVECLLNKLTK